VYIGKLGDGDEYLVEMGAGEVYRLVDKTGAGELYRLVIVMGAGEVYRVVDNIGVGFVVGNGGLYL
jgi:hypothetical protein